MKFLKRFWKGWKDGWNDYVRRMASGQYCHFLGALLPAIASAAAGALGKKDNLLNQILGGLGGLGAGLGKEEQIKPEEEYREREKYETNMMNKRRAMYQAEGFKPQTPRYEIQKDLGIFDPMIKSAVMGSFRDVFGADTVARWGMDFDQMKKVAADREIAMENDSNVGQMQPQDPGGQPKFMEDGMAHRGGGMRRPWQEQEMQ